MSDVISPDVAQVLPGLFWERVRRSPGAIAYSSFDKPSNRWVDLTWAQMAEQVSQWQVALKAESLQKGDRVAVMANNSPQWLVFEQAALALGLVVVPLFANDRAENVAYVLADSNTRLLLIEGLEQWRELATVAAELDDCMHIWSMNDCGDQRVRYVQKLLQDSGEPAELCDSSPDDLATIVYTSGTTGRPKGVMLSHRNILWNAHAGLCSVEIFPDDVFLSFLPLSHTLERTIGYYLPMMAGASVAYARSIPHLAEDLQSIRPTVLISVPRIYERTFAKIQEQLSSPLKRRLFDLAVEVGWLRFLHRQGRADWQTKLLLWPLLEKLVAGKIMDKLGGRLRIAICGGAPMPVDAGKAFIGLGLNLLQGYGMTELSPVAAVNLIENNDPASVGPPLPDVEVRIGANDELQVRSPGVMQGYWNNEKAFAETVDADGWLHTGDKARLEDGRVYITGRIKDVLVLANGEKVSPADMEMAISAHPLFEQVMVIGDNRPCLAVLVVLNKDQANEQYSNDAMLTVIAECIRSFPGYAKIRSLLTIDEPWSVENDMLTPTLKLKRENILSRYEKEIEAIYARRK